MQKLGQKTQKTAPSQGQVSPKSGSSQGSEISDKANGNHALLANNNINDKNALLEKKNTTTSNRKHTSSLVAETIENSP